MEAALCLWELFTNCLSCVGSLLLWGFVLIPRYKISFSNLRTNAGARK